MEGKKFYYCWRNTRITGVTIVKHLKCSSQTEKSERALVFAFNYNTTAISHVRFPINRIGHRDSWVHDLLRKYSQEKTIGKWGRQGKTREEAKLKCALCWIPSAWSHPGNRGDLGEQIAAQKLPTQNQGTWAVIPLIFQSLGMGHPLPGITCQASPGEVAPITPDCPLERSGAASP